ncbi:MAG: hypothetical protein ACLQAH_07450 [Limisphaerales bacterium]
MRILTLTFLATCTVAFAQTYDTNNDYVQTFAGSGEQGYYDGQGQLTKFSNPYQNRDRADLEAAAGF